MPAAEIPDLVLERDRQRLDQDPLQFRAILQDWLTAPAYKNAVDVILKKPEIPYVRSLFIESEEGFYGRTHWAVDRIRVSPP